MEVVHCVHSLSSMRITLFCLYSNMTPMRSLTVMGIYTPMLFPIHLIITSTINHQPHNTAQSHSESPEIPYIYSDFTISIFCFSLKLRTSTYSFLQVTMSENTAGETSEATHYDFSEVKQFRDLEEIEEILREQNHENREDVDITLDRFQPFLEKIGEPNSPEHTQKISILLNVIEKYATISKLNKRHLVLL